MDVPARADPEPSEPLALRIAALVHPNVVPPVIVMRGAAGTGKSVLARELARLLGGILISSDIVRKQMLGLELTARPDAGERKVVYGGPMHARTYAALVERGRTTVLSGRAVILDATYLRRTSRAEVHAMARAVGAPYAILDVECAPDVVRARLEERAARDDDVSDADWEVYQAQIAEADPIDGDEALFHVSFLSGRPVGEVLPPLLDVLERQRYERD